MTTLKLWTSVCMSLALVATLMSGTAVAQDPKAQEPKAQAQEAVFEGLLMAIDPNAKVLTLKSDDKEMQFSFTDKTELVAPDKGDGKPVAVAQGTRMRVHYTERDNQKIASKVEIIETTASR